MSHFIQLQTQIRERDHLITALRDLHYHYRASEREDIIVRGFSGKTEKAEILVEGDTYDIGFRRRPENYEVVADWWGTERDSRLRINQQTFVRQLNRQYNYNIIQDQIREQNLILEGQVEMANGDLVFTLSEQA